MGAKIYTPLTTEDMQIVTEIIHAYHPWIAENQVDIACIFVSKYDQEDNLIPCLKHHGAWAAAVVRLMRPAEQVFRNHSAEIVVDMCTWEGLSVEGKRAVLDHELTHILPAKNPKDGSLIKLDNGKLRLKMKADDFSLTGFIEIARRHGKAALEVQAIAKAHKALQDAVHQFEHPTLATEFSMALNTAVNASTVPVVVTLQSSVPAAATV